MSLPLHVQFPADQKLILRKLTDLFRNHAEAINGLLDGTSGSGGGHIIEDEGTPLTQRATLNFEGTGVTVTDSGTKTVVTISGGGGGGSSYFPGGF